jgi:glucose/arabinose dehydrogenase
VIQLPDPNDYHWVQIVDGLNQPVALTNANDNSSRIYIVEQTGVIRILLGGLLLPAPFMDIQDRVGSSGSEQGLLGLAFHPDYGQNGYFFVNYTNLAGDTIIARFQRSSVDANAGDPSSEEILLKISQPFANHNGGHVVFGTDGYLYIGTGDGGSGGDPMGNGQSLNTLLGKILRIDVNQGNPYAIPADNPFISGTGLPEIWAYGLRNPWRFSFDDQTGDLYIADVGQNLWEEVNYSQAGRGNGSNYGWNYFEGSHTFSGQPPENQVFIQPAVEYGRDMGCSVTGGRVYRGERLPEFKGVYFYGDFCSGNVWGLLPDGMDRWVNELLFNNVGRIASFGVDESGEIYLVDYTGSILLLEKK